MQVHLVKRAFIIGLAIFASAIAQAAPVLLQSFTIGSTVSGINTTATVTLSASSTSQTRVFLSSSTPSVIGLPAHVDIKPGSTSATFPATIGLVATDTQVQLTASLGLTAITLHPTVNAATFGSLSISPTIIQGGSKATGTVTFIGRVGAAGSITLPGITGLYQTPASVPVNVGQDHVTFTIETNPISVPVATEFFATYGAITEHVQIAIVPASLKSFDLPHSVASGGTVTGTVHLSGLSGPPIGGRVQLTSSDPSLTVPPRVVVPIGTDHGSFQATAGIVNNPTDVLVTATDGSKTFVQKITIQPAGLESFTASPDAVVGGTSVQGRATLDGPAVAGGAAITLASSDPSVSVPSLATIPAGQKSFNFAFPTTPVQTDTLVIISASYNGLTFSAPVLVEAASLASVSVAPSRVSGGGTVTITVVLDGPAPQFGANVFLSSGNPAIAPIPSNLLIPQGQSSASVAFPTAAVTLNTQVTITALYNGLHKTAQIMINPP